MFVTSDEFNVLGKRVERMEAAVANVVNKVFPCFGSNLSSRKNFLKISNTDAVCRILSNRR